MHEAKLHTMYVWTSVAEAKSLLQNGLIGFAGCPLETCTCKRRGWVKSFWCIIEKREFFKFFMV